MHILHATPSRLRNLSTTDKLLLATAVLGLVAVHATRRYSRSPKWKNRHQPMYYRLASPNVGNDNKLRQFAEEVTADTPSYDGFTIEDEAVKVWMHPEYLRAFNSTRSPTLCQQAAAYEACKRISDSEI